MNTGRRFGRDTRGPQIRINHRIRVPEVRVVAEDGSNLGVMSTDQALRRANEKGLDLVEVNPKSLPPVCKILDFGRYKYEEKKKQREAKRRQTVVEVKEIKLRPKTDEHDLQVKVRAARKFVESGNKVRVVCRFRGREITHPEIASQQLGFFISGLEDVGNLEQKPAMEAKAMALVIAPKPQVFHRLAQEKNRRDEERARQGQAGSEPPSDEDEDIDEDEDDDIDEDEDDDIDEDDDVDESEKDSDTNAAQT
ncbi:translation initiation factor IF-3 [Myxococcota bacterium]